MEQYKAELETARSELLTFAVNRLLRQGFDKPMAERLATEAMTAPPRVPVPLYDDL